jgi:NADPH:quinone reductase-like Zn-dependent oxidoreductase
MQWVSAALPEPNPDEVRLPVEAVGVSAYDRKTPYEALREKL